MTSLFLLVAALLLRTQDLQAATDVNPLTFRCQSEVLSIALFHKGQSLVVGEDDKKVSIWDVKFGRIKKSHVLDWSVRSVTVSSDDKILAIGTFFHQIHSISLDEDAKYTKLLTGHVGYVNSVVFSNDARTLISAGHDKKIRIWDLHTGTATHTLLGHAATVHAVVVSPVGQRLVSLAAEPDILVWECEADGDFKRMTRLKGHEHAVMSGAFSPDGSQFASVGIDRKLILWDLSRKKATWQYQDSQPIRCVKFLPNGRQMVIGTNEGYLRLLEANREKPIWTHKGHSKHVTSLAVQADGSKFYSSSFDKTIKQWDVEICVRRK